MNMHIQCYEPKFLVFGAMTSGLKPLWVTDVCTDNPFRSTTEQSYLQTYSPLAAEVEEGFVDRILAQWRAQMIPQFDTACAFALRFLFRSQFSEKYSKRTHAV